MPDLAYRLALLYICASRSEAAFTVSFVICHKNMLHSKPCLHISQSYDILLHVIWKSECPLSFTESFLLPCFCPSPAKACSCESELSIDVLIEQQDHNLKDSVPSHCRLICLSTCA